MAGKDVDSTKPSNQAVKPDVHRPTKGGFYRRDKGEKDAKIVTERTTADAPKGKVAK